MLQKFFTNTLEGDFVKALVRNFPIPVIPTVRDGDYVIENCLYIYRNNVIKVTKSGILSGKRNYIYAICSNRVLCSDSTLVSDSGLVSADYEERDFYRFGFSYPNVTESYISKNSYYDSDTHYYLGQYLRALRDIIHIDLMPFYNCFSHKYIDNLNIVAGTKEVDNLEDIYFKPPYYKLEPNNKYKTYIVPIKFNKKYTIAIDSTKEVRFKSIVYDGFNMVRSPNGGYITDELTDRSVIMTSTSFNKPFLYEISNYDANIQQHEKNLNLVIQISKDVTSSIVVLEGDYTDPSYKIYNHENIDDLSYVQADNLFLSKLQLLLINDRNSYAFSDRLIEYLLINAITQQDEISENIARVQTYISDSSKSNNYVKVGRYEYQPYKKAETLGVWDARLRAALYEIYMFNGSYKYDINGYVDKNVEKLITKGFDV